MPALPPVLLLPPLPTIPRPPLPPVPVTAPPAPPLDAPLPADPPPVALLPPEAVDPPVPPVVAPIPLLPFEQARKGQAIKRTKKRIAGSGYRAALCTSLLLGADEGTGDLRSVWELLLRRVRLWSAFLKATRPTASQKTPAVR